jgi:hypothetical protein
MIWNAKIPAKIKIILWLVLDNTILTKDNLLKRKWTGSPICHFCDKEENITHLFLQCSMAKAVWAVIAHSIGADNVPRTLQQCWIWCERWLPYGKKIHTLGIVAVCWSIWRTRNSICFEGKKGTNPITIICMACSLMCYWAGLFMEVDKDTLVAGANSMLSIALRLLKQKQAKGRTLQLEDDQEGGQNSGA